MFSPKNLARKGLNQFKFMSREDKTRHISLCLIKKFSNLSLLHSWHNSYNNENNILFRIAHWNLYIYIIYIYIYTYVIFTKYVHRGGKIIKLYSILTIANMDIAHDHFRQKDFLTAVIDHLPNVIWCDVFIRLWTVSPKYKRKAISCADGCVQSNDRKCDQQNSLNLRTSSVHFASVSCLLYGECFKQREKNNSIYREWRNYCLLGCFCCAKITVKRLKTPYCALLLYIIFYSPQTEA